jgi:hypothetical protein
MIYSEGEQERINYLFGGRDSYLIPDQSAH